ncbi:MAG TPA: zf-HC2 domain-containing protein [Pirellulales bacterium]|nr:zf-HC2 domain-containing protein [Pirellulales bacterium]
MDANHSADERLLLPLLRALDEAADVDERDDHPDDELLALFAEGALDGPERDELLRHLDECVNCRRAASLLLSLLSDENEPAETRRSRTLASPATARALASPATARTLASPATAELLRVRLRSAAVYVLAASLLVAAGLYFGFSANGPQVAQRRAYDKAKGLLAAGRFAEARDFLAAAEERGTTSDRLRSLRSQAEREFPGRLALAFAGRLGDFGYEPGGIVARETGDGKLGRGLKGAYDLLKRSGADEQDAVLNRGHALLTMRRPREALDEFQRAVEMAPTEAMAWLGRGLAEFMLDDFDAAERDFRETRRLDGKNVAARINLALALEALDRRDDATATWNEVLEGATEDGDRKLAERAIRQLEAAK